MLVPFSRHTLHLLFVSAVFLFGSVLLSPDAVCQGITPVTGFHVASESDPFAKKDVLNVISNEVPVAGVLGARATVGVRCGANWLAGTPGLGFSITLAGTDLDIVTTSSVHTSVNLFGPTTRYSTQDRSVNLKMRFDDEDKIEDSEQATDTHHVGFVYYDLDHADAAHRLLIGLSSAGHNVTLELNLRAPAIRNVIDQCRAAKVKQDQEYAEKRAEDQKQNDINTMAQMAGRPDGFSCTAVAKTDLTLTNNPGSVAAMDAGKLKQGTTLYVVDLGDDGFGYVSLISHDPRRPSDGAYMRGFAAKEDVTLQCDQQKLDAENQKRRENQTQAATVKAAELREFATRMALGPIPQEAVVPNNSQWEVVSVVLTRDVQGLHPNFGKPVVGGDTALDPIGLHAGLVCRVSEVSKTKTITNHNYIQTETCDSSDGSLRYGLFVPMNSLAYNTPDGQYRAQQSITAREAGYWQDSRTGLVWTARDNGADVDWKRAQSYCNGLQIGGFSNWRLPTPGELHGLYDSASSHQTPPLPEEVRYGRGKAVEVIPAGTTWTVHSVNGVTLSTPNVWTSYESQSGLPHVATVVSFSNGLELRPTTDYMFTMRTVCVRTP